jgi:hypothetical protein
MGRPAPSRAAGRKIVSSFGEISLKSREVTNSARGTFQDCRRKFELHYGHRLSQRGIVDYFWIGDVVHKELERMYERGKFSKAGLRKRIDKRTKEALKLCVDDTQRDKLWVASANAQGMVPIYADMYLERDLKLFDAVQCEGKFRKRIPGTEWWYRGRRDMVARTRRAIPQLDLPKGALGLWENKTTAQADTGYFAKLPLDFQVLGYVWSMWGEDHDGQDGEECSFIYYNVLQKTRLRQKQSETFGQYLDRIEADYRDNPTKYFYREKVEFSRDTVKAFVEELRKFVLNDLEPAIASGYFSMNTRQCTIRGACEFLPLCIDGPSSETMLLYSQRGAEHPELEEDD